MAQPASLAAKLSLVLAVTALLPVACRGKPAAGVNDKSASLEAAYLTPPQPVSVRADARGVELSGAAPAGSRVRLASPSGEASFAGADADGRWTFALGALASPRIFGLSATTGPRTVQAQGYLLVTPGGQAALLRAGAPAARVDASPRPGLRTLDFDAGGALEVSVAAPARATVILRLDGRQVAEGRADEAGRFTASLPATGQPAIRAGAHHVEAVGDGFADGAAVQLTPATPLAEGPLRSQLTPAGLRVDWLTPGGGVQSTILVH